LTNREDVQYSKAAILARLLIFQELYLRSAAAPAHIQKALRKIIASNIVEQARVMALEGDKKTARRKAFEALAYLPSGKNLLNSLLGLILPSLLARRKYHTK
jgi:hypothetical protein